MIVSYQLIQLIKIGETNPQPRATIICYYQGSWESDNSHSPAHSRESNAKSSPERILATIFALRVSTW